MQAIPPAERRTLSMEEAAAMLGIGRTTVYALARQGRLPGVLRFGRRLVISREAIERLLAEGNVPAATTNRSPAA